MEEFGDGQLGDLRRTRRLVAIAAQAVRKPGGRITEVFPDPAEREGTFRLLENEDVAPEAIAAAAARACVRRARPHPFVFVPVDGTSLQITDTRGTKGLGLVGARRLKSAGLQVLSAIVVAPEGTPLGLCSQRYWSRSERSTVVNEKKDTRPVGEKETRYWLQVMDESRAAFVQGNPDTRPWFQLDRGGDAGAVLLDGLWASSDSWLTVRSEYDRRLVDGQQPAHLWPRLEAQAPAANYDLVVSAGPKRTARTANMQLRYAPVAVGVTLPGWGKAPVPLWAVRTTEIDTVPDGEEPLDWLLLTTYPVHGAQDAEQVVFGYAMRWRIEQFHRAWKSGACRVEDTQLRDRDNIVRWATILASVALRILRLTYLARVTPDEPATVELSPVEIEAIIRLRKPKGVRKKDIPSIAHAVRWIADLGGYTGKSSGGPPGAVVLARGLHRIEPVVQVLSDDDEM